MFEAKVILGCINFLFFLICFLILFWTGYALYQSLIPVNKSSDKFLNFLMKVIGALLVFMLFCAFLGLIS